MAGDAAQASAAAPPPAEPRIYCAVGSGERLYQGEIIAGVMEWVPSYTPNAPDAVSEVVPMRYDLAVVMTQDCDLAQDWSKREANPTLETDLPCVLLCRAVKADEAFASEDRLRGKDLQKPIRNNKNERYQYLAEVPATVDGASQGHPAMLVDFKSLFTVRTAELYRQLRGAGNPQPRRFRLETPWAEHLQCRFAAYHARIALPRDHFIPESRRTDAPAAR